MKDYFWKLKEKGRNDTRGKLTNDKAYFLQESMPRVREYAVLRQNNLLINGKETEVEMELLFVKFQYKESADRNRLGSSYNRKI